MKRVALPLFLLSATALIAPHALVSQALAQSTASAPPGVALQLAEPSDAARLNLPALDRAKVAAEDAARTKPGPVRYALGHAVTDADAAKAAGGKGEWLDLGDGRHLWRLDVSAPGASSLDFGFTRFRLPATAELWITGTKTGDVRGPFTAADNNAARQYWTPLVHGDEARIELVLNADKREYLDLQLGTVHQGYRSPSEALKTSFPSGACNVDVACPDADGWEDQIDASVVLAFDSNGRAGTVCSGSFINSTAAGNPLPLMLSANHCGIEPSNAASLVAYFNFQNSTCRAPGSAASGQNGNGPLNVFVSGATLLAQTDPAAAAANAVTGSDFVLVRFNSAPPANSGVFYTGWDRRDLAPASATGVHHPSGAEKRISFDDDALTIAEYLGDGGSGTTHLRIGAWNLGTTEGGSSGSGLWNPDGRLVGVLSGGYAACSGNTAQDNDEPDWYGRLAHAWNTGATANRRLRDWLDPTNSGVQTLDGEFACNAPTVTLSSPAFTTAPVAGATVAFTGTASGGSGSGYTYAWDLDGDDVADRSGSANTVSTVYNARQSVQVRLTVTDSAGCSGVASQALDIKGPALTVTAAAPTQVCGNSDGKIDPGERWQVPVTLRNSGDGQISGPARVLYAASNDYAANTGAACGFDYVDIASGASAVPAVTLSPAGGGVAASDDGRSAQAITLGGGGLRLFGTTYTQAVVSTNGYVSFDNAESGGDYDNACNTAPDRGSLGPQLRPMHDDLVVGATTGSGLRYRYFATCPRAAAGAGAGCHVFQWSHMQQYSNSGPATGDFGFQALVYDGGSVVYQYETASPNAGAGATIGLVDGTGAAFDARCNVANAAPANSAICLSSLAGSVRPESPTRALLALPANESSTVNVPFFVPTSAACGAPLAMDLVAAAANNLSRVAPTRVLNANVGAGCTVVNNCPIQQLSFETKQGLYHNRVRPGNGIAHYSYGGGWYTGDAERKPTWYQLSGSVQDYLMRLPLVETHNDGSTSNVDVSLQQRGRAWLAQVSPTEIMYAWQFDDGRSGAELLSHTLSLAGFISRPATNRTETWFALNDPGWGLAVESGSNGGTTLEAIGVFLYDAAGAPRWTLGNGTGTNGQAVTLTAVRPHCPGCPWLPDYADTAAAAGTITPTWTGATGVSVNTAITFPAPLQGTWNRTALPMIPILPPVQD